VSLILKWTCTVVGLITLLSALTACSANPPDQGPAAGVTAVPLKNPSFNGDPAGVLTDWLALEHNEGGSYTFTADRKNAYSGESSARIHRTGHEIYGRLDQRVTVRPEWTGKTVRLSGMLKTENVTGNGGALILQAIGADGGISAWNHMQDKRVKGSVDWAKYAVELKTPPQAAYFRVGVMLEDGGTLWADDLQLEIVH